MKFSVNRLLATLLFLVLTVPFLSAQCLVHPTSDTLCEKSTSLLPVQLLGPTFATADSFLYELNGSGIDGSQAIVWNTTGDYQLIVTSLNTAGQITCIDTATFYVAPGPQVDYAITTADTQCFEGNKLCFRNQSTIWKEDSGSSTHRILWGDGSALFSKNLNAGESACYSYTSLQSRQYTVSVEITDQRGCISTKQYPSHYLKGIGPVLFQIDSTWCGAVKYGGNDFSISFDSTKIDSFVWMLDSVPFESTRLAFAYPLNLSGSHTFMLKTWSKDGCSASYSSSSSVFNPIISSDKGDTLFVKDGTISFYTPPVKNAQYFWNFGDQTSGPKNFSNKNTGTHTYGSPGKYIVILQESLAACSNSTDTVILFITGPLARITPPSYTVRASCNSNDTVFLSQSSLYYFNDANPANEDQPGGRRNDQVKGVWDFGDLLAPACTTDTRNGLNVNTNCRYSLDSAAKHRYPSQGKYTARYTATDTPSMESSLDSVTLQLGKPMLDDFQIEANCNSFQDNVYLRWNTQSGRPQTTFRILVDSLADRNDNTPNVLDSWIDEGQTMYDPSTPNGLKKLSGAAIHQAYIDPGYMQSFHKDGYTTVGLHLFNGDTNSVYCDTIIWLHSALKLDRMSLGANSTLTHYAQSDSITWSLADRRVLDLEEIHFDASVDYTLDGDYWAGWTSSDNYVRNHQAGSHVYDYILRTSGYKQVTTDSILIRHSNNGQLVFQDWRDTLIEIPPARFLKNGRYAARVSHVETCWNDRIEYHVVGHASAWHFSYPTMDTFMFIGDTLHMMDTLLYMLEEPDPITGAQFVPYSYWRDPLHHPDGRNRPTPPGGYETLVWKANGTTFSTSLNAQFIPTDTGWYTIEAISTDSTGRKQTLRKEIPVFGISPFLGILPDTSSLGPKMEQGDPGTKFNSDLNGLLINRDCEYFIQFEQQSAVLDPCMSRYGTPCLPEIKSGVRPGNNGPVSFFTNGDPVLLPFDVLQENQYGLVYQVGTSRTIQFDTLIDLEISIDYLVSDSILCNDEALIIDNLSTGLGQDVQYVVYTGNKLELFGDIPVFTLNSLPRGTVPTWVDAYPGEFLPGGIYCPISRPLPNIQVNGADQIEITGNVSGAIGQINLFTAEIGHTGSGTYLWTIDNGSLLSASNKDTISAFFNTGSGKLMVAYTESVCPAARDTLYFITTGFRPVVSQKIYLYPNPTKGALHIGGMEGRAMVHVYSAQGAEVFNMEVDVTGFEIEGLKPGVYLLRIEGSEASYFKFIIEE